MKDLQKRSFLLSIIISMLAIMLPQSVGVIRLLIFAIGCTALVATVVLGFEQIPEKS